MRPSDVAGRRSSAMLGLYALVLLGFVATALAVRDEFRSAQQRDIQAADDAAIKVTAALEEAVGAVRGVDAVAIDGRVDPSAFQAFARGVVRTSPFPALAYAELVPLDERAEFQADTGVTIRDTDGQGSLRPAELRDLSVVVVDVFPKNETTNAVIGFDIASDPVRARAATESIESDVAVLSERTSTVSGARPGLSVVKAVRDPAGQPLGVVTSGLAMDELVPTAGVDVDGLAGFELTVDGEALVGTPTDGATQTFDVAGRTFRVTAVDERGTGLLLPMLIGAGTLALALAVAWTARRDRRQRARLSRLSRRNRNIAELGRRLAGTLSASAVLEALALHARTILDAQWSLVVRRTLDDGEGVVVDPQGRWARGGGPANDIPEAVCVSLGSGEQHSTGSPTIDGRPIMATVADEPRSVVELLSTPLVFSSGMCVGAVAFGWTEPLTPEQAEDRSLAAITIAELASRAMERAVITEVVQQRAFDLSALARTLASAHTSDDVTTAIETGVAPLLGAEDARFVPADVELAAADSGAIVSPVKDAKGDQIGNLLIRRPESRPMDETEAALLATISDLVGQTLERTTLSEQEHEVIVQFQRALLPELPAIEGLEIASSYSPALSVVGLGGDFYDVLHVADQRTCIVVGDITGHGAEAVAAMGELKSVVHHLLSSGTTLESTLEQADLLLARRDVLATAVIVEVDTGRGELRYLNAGHPYPVLRRHDGRTSLLSGGRRAMLGLATSPSDTGPGCSTFATGDQVLLYTDGLIERRTKDIDECMADLASLVAEIDEPKLVDVVSRIEALGTAMTGRTDDDVALIAARR